MPPVGPKATGNVRQLEALTRLPGPTVLRGLSGAELKRLKRLLGHAIEYIWNPFLDGPDAEHLLRRSLPAWQDTEQARADLPPAVRDLDRESFVFLRLNYCRRRIHDIIAQRAGRRLTSEVVGELLHWEQAAAEVRAEIVRENVPLVLAMAKRTRITGVDLTDLISEGNLALLRSVDKFDTARGYRFSTYACRSILKSFSRTATKHARYRGYFPTEFNPELDNGSFQDRMRQGMEGDCVDELKHILGQNTANLTEVEQAVLRARFSLDENRDSVERKLRTLDQVGQMIGVTKERVRQIQNKALSKLRTVLEQTALVR